MMNIERSFQQSIARIVEPSGIPVGAGVLINGRRILTCAHVVRSATTQAKVGSEISLNLPFLPDSSSTASSILKGTVQVLDTERDIAVLSLPKGTHIPISPYPFILLERNANGQDRMPTLYEHRYAAYGFPLGNSKGLWTYGKVLDKRADGTFQLEGEGTTGKSVERGFSGGPVYDNSLSGFIGIMVRAEDSKAERIAYMIPLTILKEVVPDLGIARIKRSGKTVLNHDYPTVYLHFIDSTLTTTERAEIGRFKTRLSLKEVNVWVQDEGFASRSWVSHLMQGIGEADKVIFFINEVSVNELFDEIDVAILRSQLEPTFRADIIAFDQAGHDAIASRLDLFESKMVETQDKINIIPYYELPETKRDGEIDRVLAVEKVSNRLEGFTDLVFQELSRLLDDGDWDFLSGVFKKDRVLLTSPWVFEDPQKQRSHLFIKSLLTLSPEQLVNSFIGNLPREKKPNFYKQSVYIAAFAFSSWIPIHNIARMASLRNEKNGTRSISVKCRFPETIKGHLHIVDDFGKKSLTHSLLSNIDEEEPEGIEGPTDDMKRGAPFLFNKYPPETDRSKNLTRLREMIIDWVTVNNKKSRMKEKKKFEELSTVEDFDSFDMKYNTILEDYDPLPLVWTSTGPIESDPLFRDILDRFGENIHFIIHEVVVPKKNNKNKSVVIFEEEEEDGVISIPDHLEIQANNARLKFEVKRAFHLGK